ncbi:carbohydrate ABC transporter permease [Paenactinomyces guangxiensis]|uniref:Sugar ABC transporter permease n=1 Tax=Paenactinomyces guangxiensis TaxID=1490290 RepID=A0A7W1WSL6_9BACL|nr:sugar ABC transporter permease [Paenactinomyces guangxiensis]MBA4495209.1 sugar ABC transporter permease [Paenactinomyces guangxiensis]MBH8592293.1 sugar ABC transporter permease [Paenactinomyces guangxiensis]
MADLAPSTESGSLTQTAKRSQRRRERWISFLFLLPSIITIAVFVYGFIAWTGYVSLTKWNSLVQDLSFNGLANYQFLFDDFRFQSDLRNTVVFTVIFIAVCIVLGLFLATLLDQRIRMEGLFRNIFIFPMALSFIVTGVVWQWIFNPSTGVNLFLKKWGIEEPPLWYVNTKIIPGVEWGQIQAGIPLAIIAVVIAAVWQLSGFTMAMYLAGIRAIPDQLREAARVDGATEWQIFRQIILPQLRPITLSVVIILGHISLKIFDLIYAMTGPGAAFVTDMPGVYMVETTFKGSHYGQGAAIAILMLLLVSLLIIPYLISNMRKEEA